MRYILSLVDQEQLSQPARSSLKPRLRPGRSPAEWICVCSSRRTIQYGQDHLQVTALCIAVCLSLLRCYAEVIHGFTTSRGGLNTIQAPHQDRDMDQVQYICDLITSSSWPLLLIYQASGAFNKQSAMILFGGADENNNLYNDTWLFYVWLLEFISNSNSF